MKKHLKKLICTLLVLNLIFAYPVALRAEVIDLREQGEMGAAGFAAAILSGIWAGYFMPNYTNAGEMLVKTYLVPRLSREAIKVTFGLNEKDEKDAQMLGILSAGLSGFVGGGIAGVGNWSWHINNALINCGESMVGTWLNQAVQEGFKDKGLGNLISFIVGDFINPVGFLQETFFPKENVPSVEISVDTTKRYEGGQFLSHDGKTMFKLQNGQYVKVAEKGTDGKFYKADATGEKSDVEYTVKGYVHQLQEPQAQVSEYKGRRVLSFAKVKNKDNTFGAKYQRLRENISNSIRGFFKLPPLQTQSQQQGSNQGLNILPSTIGQDTLQYPGMDLKTPKQIDIQNPTAGVPSEIKTQPISPESAGAQEIDKQTK